MIAVAVAASKKTGKPAKPGGRPKGAVLLLVAVPKGKPPKGGQGKGKPAPC